VKIRRLRVLLILGRVSNLPTVWSNCLAAWLIGGAGQWRRFVELGVAGTLLYTGGMFLNDAFDENFDRQFRPERPIPAGQIHPQAVWCGGIILLLLGCLLLLPLGTTSLALGIALSAAIVIYDAIHKRTVLAPLLMSLCRFLLYLTAGVAGEHGISLVLIARALALAAYISGISYLARGESRQGAAPPWTIGLLIVPGVLATLLRDRPQSATILLVTFFAGWLAWCLRGAWLVPKRPLSLGVASLLAGIVLVDWLAVPGQAWRNLAFPALFFLALLLQRVVPAT